MRLFNASVCAALCGAIALLASGCTELQTSGGLSSGLSASGSGSAGGASETIGLSKHDIALRFLTAYIRLDRNMALNYATPQAVSRLDWNMPHAGNIPYYDDKMLLQFRGGWARVFFQDMGNTYKIVDIEVHRR
ncbi:MAG TPA: hypothetical protein PLA50_12045 [Bacteroidia bacterium]|nr:hypothetical protein [Bacteroidia bacterium]